MTSHVKIKFSILVQQHSGAIEFHGFNETACALIQMPTKKISVLVVTPMLHVFLSVLELL